VLRLGESVVVYGRRWKPSVVTLMAWLLRAMTETRCFLSFFRLRDYGTVPAGWGLRVWYDARGQRQARQKRRAAG
jgi:hypothetical protein